MKRIVPAILAGVLLTSCSHKQHEETPPPASPAPTVYDPKRDQEEVRERAARHEEVRRLHQERENRASKVGVAMYDTQTGKSYVVTRKPRQISHTNNHELYVMHKLAERDALSGRGVRNEESEALMRNLTPEQVEEMSREAIDVTNYNNGTFNLWGQKQ